MDTGAERNTQRDAQAERAAEIGNFIGTNGIEPVSSRFLGLAGGTDAANTYILPDAAWNDAERSLKNDIRNDTGMELVLVSGGMEVQTPDGLRTANGVITGDKLVAQADNAYFTAIQIGMHEWYHAKARRNPALVRDTRNEIRAAKSGAELDAISGAYAQSYDGMYGGIYEWVLEEVFADAYAGMNRFGAGAPQYADTVRGAAGHRGLSLPTLDEANGVRATRGPPTDAARPNAELKMQNAELRMQNAEFCPTICLRGIF